MNYLEIIKKSLEIVRKHKALWFLGLLAMFAEGGTQLNSSSNFLRTSNNDFTSGGIQAGVGTLSDEIITKVNSIDILVLISVIIALLIVIIAIIYLSNVSSAALISNVNHIEESGESKSFHDSFMESRKFFWRFFLLGLFFSVALLIYLAIIVTPLVLLSFNLESGFAIFIFVSLLILGTLILIPLSVYMSIINIIAKREIVINSRSLIPSITEASKLINKLLGKTIITWLLGSALNSLASLALFLIILFISAVLGVIGVVMVFTSLKLLGIAYLFILLTIIVILIAFASAIITSYISTYWTLSFRALKYLSKVKAVKS